MKETPEKYLQAVMIGDRKPHNRTIHLAPYNLEWPSRFSRLARRVRQALGEKVLLLKHVGSTSIEGMPAKPIIDMVMVVVDTTDESSYVPPLEEHGFVLRLREPEWLEWYKGYIKELKSRLTKERIITHIDLMKDFVRNYEFHAEDLASWKGDMLLTVAENDVILNYFEGMKQLYPNAKSHMFPKGLGAHSLGLITLLVFNRRIRAFLKNSNNAADG